VYPVLTAVCLIALNFVLNLMLATMVSTTILTRIAASIAVILPMGLLMGLFFPTGMKLTKSLSSAETPWYWALNGVFGVLCSAVAVFISIYVGISKNIYIAAVCYSAVIITQVGLQQKHR